MLSNMKMNCSVKSSKNYKKKMLNSKETLKKLHQALPNLTLDELFIILDCYTEEYTYNFKDFELPKVWYGTTTNEPIQCSSINAIDGPYTSKYGGISSEIKSNGNISITTRKPDYKFNTSN